MRNLKLTTLTLIFGLTLSIFAATLSYADDSKTVQGNVICLIPDYAKGTVNPVIATHPCDGLPPHQHVLVTETRVYSLQGLQDGLMKIERNPNRTNVKITGKVEGSEQNGWILFVN
ncbi:MAG: hypothetical protein DHS20C13_10870 [Thermodesulfobacteriota bacterium]|nr:MAG: hypothetical protein DHS20C13_10870 [Thermodesulfobacteriota bacterium]